MDLKELMLKYDEQDAQCEQKKAELEESIRLRSDIVEEISKAISPKRRIVRNGRELTIVARSSKAGEHTTWFFKGSKNSDAVEID